LLYGEREREREREVREKIIKKIKYKAIGTVYIYTVIMEK